MNDKKKPTFLSFKYLAPIDLEDQNWEPRCTTLSVKNVSRRTHPYDTHNLILYVFLSLLDSSDEFECYENVFIILLHRRSFDLVEFHHWSKQTDFSFGFISHCDSSVLSHLGL